MSVLQPGSKRKQPPPAQEEGASTAAPRWEAGQREAPVGGRQLFVSVQQKLKGEGSPRPMQASFWHTRPRRVGLLPS